MFILLMIFGAMLLLACNPFGDDEEEGASDESQVVEVGNQISSEKGNQGNQLTEQTGPGAANSPGEASAEAAQENPQLEGSENPVSQDKSPPSKQLTEGAAATFSPEEARDLVWAYLSQCIALAAAELEAHEIRGEWFVQATGDSPDKYGLWKVDPATGAVQPHNIRAREWNPLVNPNCTRELFNGFFTPTPPPLLNSVVTKANHAVTALWATLVKCHPALRVEELQATLNSAKAEWVVTTKPDAYANYGIWIIQGGESIIPFNRQAQALHQQLGSGLC
jgi:hypothetical protein